MCGICGIFNYSNVNFEISEHLVMGMRDTMVHRGPDDAGCYISEDRRVGLGHRRLSIIDLSTSGHQPMVNEDGTIWITFNGEIYNHRKLRTELEARGHRYKSRTDTETILHLYEEKGADCVYELEGMFAWAIWDSRKRQLFLVRDRIGKKPLYYTQQKGQLIFASEIKAILQHPQISRDIDPVALYHYLTFFVTPAPSTLFQGINKIPPGFLIICEEDGKITRKQYWDAIVESADRNLPEEYYIRNVRELLAQSVQKRMMSDVPVGVLLSGGIDSSTNVALMAQLTERPVETFSVGYKDQPAYNELENARQVARHFKTSHHEIIIDYQDVIDYVPKLVHHQDEPVADWVCVPLYFLSKLARENGVIVIQIGEGSDEIFFGYEGYMKTLDLHHKYWTTYMQIPQVMRQMVHNLSFLIPPIIGNSRIDKSISIKEILRRAAFNEEFFWGGTAFTETHKKQLLKNSIHEHNLNSASIVDEHISRISREKPESDFVERLIYLELKNRLAELLLMRIDKITMSNSVEGRAPFLDHKLVEFVMSMPSELKVKGGQGKYILKKAVEGILPNSIIYRKKQGFSVPVKEWFTGVLGRYISQAILDSKIKEQGYFDYTLLKSWIEKQQSGEQDNSVNLWVIFNLSQWYDHWIAGERI